MTLVMGGSHFLGVRKTENFFMVSPVVGRLKKWVHLRRQRDKRLLHSTHSSESPDSKGAPHRNDPVPPVNLVETVPTPKKVLLRNTPTEIQESTTVHRVQKRDSSRRPEQDVAPKSTPLVLHGAQSSESQTPPTNPLLTFRFDVPAILRHLPPHPLV